MSSSWYNIINKYSFEKEGTISIAVIGGGIYGCHIANELANAGANITLYEKESTLFSGASSWGDTRIHSGVKYLRNKKTQNLLIEEQSRFIEKYPHFLTSDREHEHEIQMVSEDSTSFLDFGSFIDLYDKSVNGKLVLFSDYPSITYPQIDSLSNKNSWSKVMSKSEIETIFPFQNVEGGVLHGVDICPKMYIDLPRDWFYKELSKKENVSLELGKLVELNKNHTTLTNNSSKLHVLSQNNKSRFTFKIDNSLFDYVINCTYNQSFPFFLGDNEKEAPFYEVGFSLVFAEKNSPSTSKRKIFRPFSIYDGPFPGMTPLNIKNIERTMFANFKNRKLYTATSGRLGESLNLYNVKDAYSIKEKGNNQAYNRFIDNDFYTINDQEEDVVNVLLSIKNYYPDLMESFDVIYRFWWIKSLYPSASSARPVMVQSNKDIHQKFLSVFSSKLSTVLKAEDLLYKQMSEIDNI